MRTKDPMAQLIPIDKCSECGQEFVRRCAREEWGYRTKGPNGLILFCSAPCAKAYERRKFMKRVEETKTLPAYRARQLVKAGMLKSEALRQVGLKHHAAINLLELHRWRELEWLDAHENRSE